MKRILFTIKAISIIFLASFIFLESLIIIDSFRTTDEKVDYVIVLGARLYGDIPSPALLERLITAKAYLEDNEDINVVVSGGQGTGEKIAEAFAMKTYLADNAIEEDRIIIEDRSTNTFENLKMSLDRIRKIDDRDDLKILISTNRYHLFRAKMLARRLGVKAYGLPAKIPPTIILNSYIREYFAVIKSFLFDR